MKRKIIEAKKITLVEQIRYKLTAEIFGTTEKEGTGIFYTSFNKK